MHNLNINFMVIYKILLLMSKNMVVKVLFGASIILAGLFLALPEYLGPLARYGSDSFTVGRLVGIAAVVFEAWWAVRQLRK